MHILVTDISTLPLYQDSFLKHETDGLGSISDGDDYRPEGYSSADLKHRAEDDLPESHPKKHVCGTVLTFALYIFLIPYFYI